MSAGGTRSRRPPTRALLATVVTVTLAASACSREDRPPGDLESTVVVSAASSLTGAFQEIEAAFEAAHPGVDVILNLGASSTLREQIVAGAPVDVFAPASIADIEAIGTLEYTVFASNPLVIAVPAGNPAGVAGLSDFARDDLLIGLCAPGVPCGDLARAVLASAGVVPAIDTNEPNVRALLTRLELGELDAGIVYATDIGAAVEAIEIPDEHSRSARYPIAVLGDAPHPEAAAAFVSFVLTGPGRAILAEYGFGSP